MGKKAIENRNPQFIFRIPVILKFNPGHVGTDDVRMELNDPEFVFLRPNGLKNAGTDYCRYLPDRNPEQKS